MTQRTKDEWQPADDPMPVMVNQGGRTPEAAPLVFCWQQWPTRRHASPRPGTALAAAIQQKYGQAAAAQRMVRVEPGVTASVSEGAQPHAGFDAEPLSLPLPLPLPTPSQTTKTPATPRPDANRMPSQPVAAQPTPTIPVATARPVTAAPVGPSLPPSGPPAVPPAVQQGGYTRLEPRVQTRLAGLLQMRIPAVKLYVNHAADALVRKHRADALTYGDNILLRTDTYQPHTQAGLGLLGHEVTHVQQANKGNPPRTRAGRSEQEEAALHNERQILQQLAPPWSPLSTPASPVAPIAQGGRPAWTALPAAVAQPQAAASDRDVGPPARAMPAPTAALAEPQLQAIKELVYRDLLQRIRIEFERGG